MPSHGPCSHRMGIQLFGVPFVGRINQGVERRPRCVDKDIRRERDLTDSDDDEL